MADTDPTEELLTGVENYLAALPDSDFDDLVSRVRVPDDAETDDKVARPASLSGGLAAGAARFASKRGRS